MIGIYLHHTLASAERSKYQLFEKYFFASYFNKHVRKLCVDLRIRTAAPFEMTPMTPMTYIKL